MKIISTTKNISLALPVRLLLCFLFSFSLFTGYGQEKVRKTIHIEHADSVLYDYMVVRNAQRWIGNVKLSHDKMVLYCDSAWSYPSSNSADCFGNVHIVSHDTMHMYAKTINYKGDESMAKARGNVILKDPKMTLTTDSLDFDSKNEIGYYLNWGKIVDSTNTLTSKVGTYYSEKNEMFFRDSVKVLNKNYVMTSDTMKYNTQTEIVRILGPTHIIGDSTYLYSENGWFDTQKNTTELLKNSMIRRGDTQIRGNYIFYNDKTGEGNAHGNVIIHDFKNNLIVAGNKATYNDFSQYAYVTDSTLFIQYSQKDSLYLHADTLYTQPDTSAKNQKKIECYHNVRFYKADMQGMCDSMVYFTKDSMIQLHDNPVLWSDNNQMTSDYIEMINKSVPPSTINLKNNSFIIQEIDTSKYNQIKGKDMEGLIANSKLYRINVSGNGQSIYYPIDNTKQAVGMNKAESSKIVLYLKDNKFYRITFVKSPVGTLSPITGTVDPGSRLEGFNWRGQDRPINNLDVFRSKDGSPLPLQLPNMSMDKILPPVQGLRDSTLNSIQDKQ